MAGSFVFEFDEAQRAVVRMAGRGADGSRVASCEHALREAWCAGASRPPSNARAHVDECFVAIPHGTRVSTTRTPHVSVRAWRLALQRRVCLVALSLLCSNSSAFADTNDNIDTNEDKRASSIATTVPPPDKPLWELGVGAGVAAFAHYPGSDQTRAWVFPFPYVVYRGKYFRADRDGVRGQLLDTDRVNLNLSVLGSLPVSSRDDNARAGMPDLKPTIELGPSVEIHLWRSEGRDMALDLRLPARLGVTLEGSPKPVGWQFTPNLNLDITDIAGVHDLRMGMFAGPIFADRKYSAHYYSVAPQYATPGRPTFDAGGGYAGAQALVSMSRRFSHYWVGTFVRYQNLAGARFVDSPLVRQKSVLSGGVAVAYVFGKSSRTVASDE